jgi:hypothetical protein
MKNIQKNRYNILLLFFFAFLFFSCRKEVNSVIKPSAFPIGEKLFPVEGSENTLVTLTGLNLGSIKTIVFDKGNITAAFNPNFNTDKALLFRVPTDAQNGLQNIVITNTLDKSVTLPFKVLGYPVITSVSNYYFTTGTQITLTGKNLLDVSRIFFSGSSTLGPTIKSKTATEIVVEFPATTVSRTALDITNLTGTVTTSQEFISYDNNYAFFLDDYQNGQADASWGDVNISTTDFKSGLTSFGHKFSKGSYLQMGFGFGASDVVNDNYQYLSFWMKGGTIDLDIWIFTQQTIGLYECYGQESNKILVPANVWTYFKIPVSKLKLWNNGPAFNQIGWRLKGPDNADEKLYLDDVMLVK